MHVRGWSKVCRHLLIEPFLSCEFVGSDVVPLHALALEAALVLLDHLLDVLLVLLNQVVVLRLQVLATVHTNGG